MLKKCFGVLLLILFAVFTFGNAAVYADDTPASAPAVFVDGSQLTFEANPFIDNGSTLVPFRAIFEKLGLTVKWDGATQTVTGSNDQLNIELKIGSSTATINGKTKELSLAPKIVQNITFVPLRFIGEASGREVSWDGLTQTIYIADTATQIKHIYERQALGWTNSDVEGATSILNPNTKSYEFTKMTMRDFFKVYKVQMTNEDITILKIDGDKARVQNTFTKRKIDGPAQFKNFQMVVEDTLTRIDGEWKISSSVVKKSTFLD